MHTNNSLSVLYVTNARIPTEKAHGLQIVKTIEALQRQGVAIELVVPKRLNHISRPATEFYGVSNFKVNYVRSWVWWLEYILPQVFLRLNRPFFCVQALFYISKNKPRTVVTRDLMLAFWIEHLLSIKVVFENHEPRKSFIWLYKAIVRRLSNQILVARGLVSLYERWEVSKNKYNWIPNGVDLGQSETIRRNYSLWSKTFGIDHSKKVVLYTGHFYDWKGIPTLLKASALLPEDVVVVLIGGTEASYELVQKKVNEDRLTKVYLHKFMSQMDVLSFVHSADVLVIPNTKTEKRSAEYTTPIKLFEYMASGTPIVASDIPSIRWFLQSDKNAQLFRADDPASLAETICEVLSKPNPAFERAQQAKKDAEQYTWEKRAKKIKALL